MQILRLLPYLCYNLTIIIRNYCTPFEIISQVFENIFPNTIYWVKMNNLGFRLKQIRTNKHLTQTEFGIALGVTKQAIANIECSHSNPSIEFLSKLIENFDVNVNWLITGNGVTFNSLPDNKISSYDEEFTIKVKEILRSEGLI